MQQGLKDICRTKRDPWGICLQNLEEVNHLRRPSSHNATEVARRDEPAPLIAIESYSGDEAFTNSAFEVIFSDITLKIKNKQIPKDSAPKIGNGVELNIMLAI